MHIVQVEIDNFKSFSRKTKIPFYEGYTVISGPNGSGKSNIIDAILFVLSLSSSRSLRADKMTDFINLTSGKNTAEVSVEFSDGTKIRRRIKQTPTQTYSYYYLNEKTSSQSEILDYLAKNGIRPHGYNVVMQGDINSIMTMSDRDRRGIIDSIAGVAEFDVKKDQALTELDQVRAKIEREELLLEEYSRQLTNLSSAREDAVKYKKLNDELTYLNAAKQSVTIHEKEHEIATISETRLEQERQRGVIEESIRLEENERDARTEEANEIAQKISAMQGPEYLKIITGQEQQKANIRLAEDRIRRARKDKENALGKITPLFQEIQRSQNSYKDKDMEVKKLQIDRANLAMEVESQKKIFTQVQETLEKRGEDKKGATAELTELMRNLDQKNDERRVVVLRRDSIIEQSRIRLSQLEKYREDQEGFAEERTSTQAEISRLEEEIGDARQEKSVISKQVAEAERQTLHTRKQLEALRSEIQRLTNRQMQLEANQRAAGGSDRSIEAVSEFDGVFGPISKLGKVLKAEHTVALNIAAGGRLKNIVVSDDQVAADCIEHLREERLGRLTFLPLNKMKPQPPLPPLAGNGVIDYAINLIDFEPEYRDAFNLVFGQTVVVENLDAGRRLMGKYRMVTLQGDLLERGGAMTGGSIDKNIRGFGVSVGSESSELVVKIAELKEEETALESAEKRYKSVSDGLREQLNTQGSKITNLELTIQNCNRILDKIAEDEQKGAILVEETERDAKENSDKIAALEVEIEEISAVIDGLNKRTAELKEILNEEEFNLLTERYTRAQKEYNDAQRRLEQKTTNLNDVLLERNYFKKNIEQKTADKAELDAKISEYDAEISHCNEDIDKANESIAAFAEELKKFTGEIEELNQEQIRIRSIADEATLRITKLQGDIERCNVQIAALIEHSEKLATEIAELKGNIEEAVECDLSMNEILDGIVAAERGIKRLGNVNMKAIEEFDELERKTNEKMERKNVLSHERETILEKIEGFRQMKFEVFMKAYNAINENFQRIYAHLNDGSGQLVLDNYEDPFLGGMTFEVSPRGKEVHRLNMMSGGEKSLTTLSFIFAIQQYMPAPFYALDEVDSALDGLNVERLANMVRDICLNTQIVIVSHRKPMIETADRMMGVTTRPTDKSTLVTGIITKTDSAAGAKRKSESAETEK